MFPKKAYLGSQDHKHATAVAFGQRHQFQDSLVRFVELDFSALFDVLAISVLRMAPEFREYVSLVL